MGENPNGAAWAAAAEAAAAAGSSLVLAIEALNSYLAIYWILASEMIVKAAFGMGQDTRCPGLMRMQHTNSLELRTLVVPARLVRVGARPAIDAAIVDERQSAALCHREFFRSEFAVGDVDNGSRHGTFIGMHTRRLSIRGGRRSSGRSAARAGRTAHQRRCQRTTPAAPPKPHLARHRLC